MPSNANVATITLITLIYAPPGPAEGAGRGSAARVGNRSREGTALLATSVSHQLSRLGAATGVKLVQRVGRGIRLTPEGHLLANRATEILGRVDAATNELAAQVGLPTGRVRLAASASTLSTIVPKRPPGWPEHTRDSN
jgi:hypothetical protein